MSVSVIRVYRSCQADGRRHFSTASRWKALSRTGTDLVLVRKASPSLTVANNTIKKHHQQQPVAWNIKFSDQHKWQHKTTSSQGTWKKFFWSGLGLITIAKTTDLLDFFPNCFTVHAAKPFVDAGDGGYRDRPGGYDDNNNNKQIVNNYGNNLSNRQRFNFVADVVEKAVKAVVCIQVKNHSMVDFRGVPRAANNGSGFIIEENGLILTNAHVVNNAGRSAIAVHLSDGRVYAGRVESVDCETDLALIRIQEKGLPTLKLASSSEIRLGEWVVAIGSPLSLSNSVTAGVVSNVKRGASELGIRTNISYIQTDAAITFGNSGGPLVNLDGEAIGINTYKVAAGISFAIPSDYVKEFLRRCEARRKEGKTQKQRRYIGLTFITLTEDMVLDLDQRWDSGRPNEGVFVWTVVVGSPAYLAGIQPGDVIAKINGKVIRQTKDVFDSIEECHTLDVVTLRNGKTYQCTIYPRDIPVLS